MTDFAIFALVFNVSILVLNIAAGIATTGRPLRINGALSASLTLLVFISLSVILADAASTHTSGGDFMRYHADVLTIQDSDPGREPGFEAILSMANLIGSSPDGTATIFYLFFLMPWIIIAFLRRRNSTFGMVLLAILSVWPFTADYIWVTTRQGIGISWLVLALIIADRTVQNPKARVGYLLAALLFAGIAASMHQYILGLTLMVLTVLCAHAIIGSRVTRILIISVWCSVMFGAAFRILPDLSVLISHIPGQSNYIQYFSTGFMELYGRSGFRMEIIVITTVLGLVLILIDHKKSRLMGENFHLRPSTYAFLVGSIVYALFSSIAFSDRLAIPLWFIVIPLLADTLAGSNHFKLRTEYQDVRVHPYSSSGVRSYVRRNIGPLFSLRNKDIRHQG